MTHEAGVWAALVQQATCMSGRGELGPGHAMLAKAVHANAMQESLPFWICWLGGRLWVSKGVTSCSQEGARPKASSSATQVRHHLYPREVPRNG